MKRASQFIVVLLVGFLVYGIVERVLSAKAEEKFQLERSRCHSVLREQWKQSEGMATLGTGDNKDYYFVDWSKQPEPLEKLPSKRPLMYDRRMNNHDGRGINILMVDGSIEWDSNAKWLKRFAAEHWDAKLPMPE
ncbi:MAG TPA: hypothetical protein PLC99_25320 [Verrucomicrobiota bacterium]|nr:hypothetical protein [Verrucomicrobiota bacterium]